MSYPDEVVDVALRIMQGTLDLSEAQAQVETETGFRVGQRQLEIWRDSQRFKDVEKREAQALEDDSVRTLRANAKQAGDLVEKMLLRMESVSDKDLPAALRAVADVQAKSVDKLLALTGRAPTDKNDGNFGGLLEAMVERGLIKVNVDIGKKADVESTAEIEQ